MAEEIRKLADSSTKSIARIKETVDAICAGSAETYAEIKHVEEGISQVSTAIAHMAGAAQELGAMAHKLEKTAEEL